MDGALGPNPPPSATSGSIDGTTFSKLANSFSTLIDSVANVMPAQVAGSKRSYRSIVTREVLNLTNDKCIPATLTPPPMSTRTPNTANRRKQVIGATKQPTMFKAGATVTITTSNSLKLKVNQTLKPPQERMSKAEQQKKTTCIQCRWGDQVFNHFPAQTVHKKQHKGPIIAQSGWAV